MGDLGPQRLSQACAPVCVHTCVCPLHDHMCTGAPRLAHAAGQQLLKVANHSVLLVIWLVSQAFQPPCWTWGVDSEHRQPPEGAALQPTASSRQGRDLQNSQEFYLKTGGQRVQLVSSHCSLPVFNERSFPLCPQPTDTLKGHKTQ